MSDLIQNPTVTNPIMLPALIQPALVEEQPVATQVEVHAHQDIAPTEKEVEPLAESPNEEPDPANPEPELPKGNSASDTVDDENEPFIFSAEEMLQDKMEKIPVLWDPFFPKVGLVAVVGSSDTGKSTFLRDFAMHVVQKEKTFLDFALNPKHGAALYISTEDDRFAISYLLQLQKEKGTHAKSYAKLRFMFETENLIERIKGAIAEQPVDCIIVDSFGDVMEGDLNRSTDVRRYLDQFSKIAVRNEILVIFLHHTSKKSDQNNPSKQFILGSQGFEAKMRMVAELRQDREDSEFRHFCVLKGNYIPSEFKGKSYVLGFGDDLRFTNMDTRVSFDCLSSKQGAPDWNKVKARAKELQAEGKTVRLISDMLKGEGFIVSKTKVAELIKAA